MYDAPIPVINYVFVTITAGVLAYATAMDVNDTNNTGSATDSLPSFGDIKESEPAKAEEPEPVQEIEEEPVPMAEAQVVPQSESEKSGPAFGGKRHARKIKKTKRNVHNSKKRKQTRNKNHSK
jgi:hypothetical protein